MTGFDEIAVYIVHNRQTGKDRAFSKSVPASRYMDRADNDYGAVICTRRAVWSDRPDDIEKYIALGGK